MALGSNFSSDSSLLPGPGIIYLASLPLYFLICINTDFKALGTKQALGHCSIHTTDKEPKPEELIELV